MITPGDIELLRLFLADPAGNTESFHDDILTTLWDDNSEDVYAAAADGWRIKAGKVAELYAAQIDGSYLSREQIWEHCIRMADHYEKLGGGGMVSVRMDSNAGGYPTAESSSEL